MKNEFLQALTHVNYNSNWIQCQANGLCIIEVHEPNTSVDIVQKSLHFQFIYFNIANTVIFSMEDFFLFLFFFPEDFMLSCKVLLLTSFNFFFFFYVVKLPIPFNWRWTEWYLFQDHFHTWLTYSQIQLRVSE